ncbi:MAG: hypothetical protein N3G74_02625 [Candidatus Micrarchaeota archaeon]|nr:hypothetical protein [Candidatus Micrarchaeota archaeon]
MFDSNNNITGFKEPESSMYPIGGHEVGYARYCFAQAVPRDNLAEIQFVLEEKS